MDTRELWERSGSLQAVVQTYNDLQDGLSDVDRLLFQHKLQQAESVSSVCCVDGLCHHSVVCKLPRSQAAFSPPTRPGNEAMS